MFDVFNKTSFIINCFDKNASFTLSVLFGVSFLISLIEVLSIGILLPYINMITNQENLFLFNNYNFLKLSFDNFLVSVGLSLVFFFIFRTFLLYFLYKKQYDTIFTINTKLSKHLLSSYMLLKYVDFIGLNSNVLLKDVTQEITGFIQGILLPLVNLMIELVVIFLLIVLLLYIDYQLLIIIFTFMLPVMIYLYVKVQKKMTHAGLLREASLSGIYNFSEETLKSYKEIYVFNTYNRLFKIFTIMLEDFRSANVAFQLFNQLPRLVIETTVFVLMIFIALIMVLLTRYDASDIGGLLIFGIALLRILPSINRINSSLVKMKYYIPSLKIISGALEKNKVAGSSLLIRDKISSKDVSLIKQIDLNSFSLTYNNKNVIDNQDFSVKKNEKIAIVGKSGSGKSTLIDIISGFIEIDSGSYSVDKIPVSYRSYVNSVMQKISLVSQTTFFYDDTLINNIDLIKNPGSIFDDSKVRNLLIEFGLEVFADNLDQNLGQNSINLSGGERQRLAIIRALVADREILILDESLSAIDKENEAKILKYILNLDKTVIMVSHNLDKINNFDKVFLVSDGKINTLDNLSKKEDLERFLR